MSKTGFDPKIVRFGSFLTDKCQAIFFTNFCLSPHRRPGQKPEESKKDLAPGAENTR